MSAKRAATTELNHENWDQDDPDEHEEMGTFKPASKEAIQKRVIKTARRRTQNPSEGAKQGVFSAFGGFSKAQPSSFDFLANLTNGKKPENGSPSTKTDTGVSSTGFNTSPATSSPSARPATSSPSGGLFSMPVSSSSNKPLVNPTSQSSSLFGSSTSTSSNLFTASKADSTVGLSFKPKSTSSDTTKTETSVVSSTMFGIPPNNTEAKKSLFSTAATSSFKGQSVSSPTTFTANTSATPKADSKSTEVKSGESDKKLTYYTKLKGLNESVSDWIKQHVEKTPLCILSPIFKDYEKYLKEIQEEYHGPDSDDATKKHSENKITVESKPEQATMKSSPFSAYSSPFSNSNLKTNSTSPFAKQSSSNSVCEKAASTGSVSSASSPPKSQGFPFGVNSSPQNSTLGTNSAAPPPFSFGIGKPFSINNFNAPKPSEAENKEDADDEPPKVEFTPVVEKDSVYEKKCKIFVKKEGNFADRGVGTLYIKKVEESGKYQLLVRANTNLGNVMLNLILASAIPTQRMGKNNVMMVCIPTPDAKPPPTPILIRVKTSEEADELLETLNKYKN